jgi:DNA polymerase III delta prime subunit
MNDTDFSQKYRPSSIDDVILPEVIHRRLSKLIGQGGGLSLMFYGSPGCGKTTSALLINPENTLLINCTSENSINMVRELEKTCSSMTLDGSRRIVVLDEADYLSKDAQAALRGVVERLSKANHFIMTANEPERLSDAIRSRFLSICFDISRNPELKLVMIKRLRQIADIEGGTEIKDRDIERIVEFCFPDMRRMLKSLQVELLDLVA